VAEAHPEDGQLAAALRELWADQPLTRSQGTRNLEIAQRYSWDAYADALVGVYERVLADTGNGR